MRCGGLHTIAGAAGSKNSRAPRTRHHDDETEEGLAAVNPIFRTALVLREVDDLSYEEIAEVLEVSIGTVKSRILRGREALRGYLSGRLNSRAAVQLVPGAVK